MVYRDEILRALHCGELPPDMCDGLAELEDLRVTPAPVIAGERTKEAPDDSRLDRPSLSEARRNSS